MKGRKVKGEKVVQVVAAAALGVSCIVCAIGICSMKEYVLTLKFSFLSLYRDQHERTPQRNAKLVIILEEHITIIIKLHHIM